MTGTAPAEQLSMTSSNPVLSRPQFGRRGGQKTAVRDPRAEVVSVPWSRAAPGGPGGRSEETGPPTPLPPLPHPLLVADLMTMDHVLSRAAAGLAVTLGAAALSWTLLSRFPLGTAEGFGVAAVAGVVAAALVVARCRGERPSPALTLVFAALQGVFLSVLATTVSALFAPGLLVQTVLGTTAASAGSLLVYKLHWVRAGRRFRPFAAAALVGACLLVLTDWFLRPLLGMTDLGLRILGLGAFAGAVGVALAAAFLSLHFRKVEDAITYGASRDRSWPAAFGITLTLTWLYVETVRLLTLYPNEEIFYY